MFLHEQYFNYIVLGSLSHTTYFSLQIFRNVNIFLDTVKPELMTTSEQRPPVNYDRKHGAPRMVVVHRFESI